MLPLGEEERVIAAFCAGADQELEACGKALEQAWQLPHVVNVSDLLRELRASRRPKPPSLKEQAMLAIDTAVADGCLSADVSSIVRRALEQLPDAL